MRALRFHGNKDIRVDEIPEPPLKPGWVKVKNAWAGICGSDLHEYLIGPKNAPTQPHILTGEALPSVLGHEFSGTIAALASDVTDLSIGQKVAVFPVLGDGTCHYCQHEILGMCPKWGFLGYSGYGGGMAEYVCVERRAIHKLPESMSLEVGALVEPLAVAWHAVKLKTPKPGDVALVLGAGPIGIAVILALRAHAVTTILVSEPSPTRRAHATSSGATHVIDPFSTPLAPYLATIHDGLGPHTVYECAGVQASLDAAVQSVRGRGTIINIALFEKLPVLDTSRMNRKSVTYIGSNIYTRGEFDEVIGAIADGRIGEPERMITGRVGMGEAVRGGFEELVAKGGRERHVKILVDPWG